MVAAAGSMGNTSRVDLQAWLVDEGIKHSIKVVHQGKGQWQERHEGAHFAELLNSPDPKQRDRVVDAAAQLLMYMVGLPDGSIVEIVMLACLDNSSQESQASTNQICCECQSAYDQQLAALGLLQYSAR